MKVRKGWVCRVEEANDPGYFVAPPQCLTIDKVFKDEKKEPVSDQKKLIAFEKEKDIPKFDEKKLKVFKEKDILKTNEKKLKVFEDKRGDI